METNAITAKFGVDASGTRAGLAEAQREVDRAVPKIAAAMSKAGGINVRTADIAKAFAKSEADAIASAKRTAEAVAKAYESTRIKVSQGDIVKAFAQGDIDALASAKRTSGATTKIKQAENAFLIALDQERERKLQKSAAKGEHETGHGGGHAGTGLRVFGDVINAATGGSGAVSAIQGLAHGPLGAIGAIGIGLAAVVEGLRETRKHAIETRDSLRDLDSGNAGSQTFGELEQKLSATKALQKESLADIGSGMKTIFMDALGGPFEEHYTQTQRTAQASAFKAREMEGVVLDQLLEKHQSIFEVETKRATLGSQVADLAASELKYNEDLGDIQEKTKNFPEKQLGMNQQAANERDRRNLEINRQHDLARNAASQALASAEGGNEAQRLGFNDPLEGLRRKSEVLSREYADAITDSAKARPDDQSAANLRVKQAQGAAEAGVNAVDELVKARKRALELETNSTEVMQAQLGGETAKAEVLQLQFSYKQRIEAADAERNSALSEQIKKEQAIAVALQGQLSARQARAEIEQNINSRESVMGLQIDATTGPGAAAQLSAQQQKLRVASIAQAARLGLAAMNPFAADQQGILSHAAAIKQQQNSISEAQRANSEAVANAAVANSATSLNQHGKRTLGEQALRESARQMELADAARNNPALIPVINQKYDLAQNQSDIDEYLKSPEQKRAERAQNRRLNRAARTIDARNRERARNGGGPMQGPPAPGDAAAAGMTVSPADFGANGFKDVVSAVDKVASAIGGLDLKARAG